MIDNENMGATEARETFAQQVAGHSGAIADEAIAVIPEGWQPHDLEYLDKHPRRRRGEFRFTRIESLVNYLLRVCPKAGDKKATPNPTVLAWADTHDHQIIAVLNDHQGDGELGLSTGKPGWGDWRAEFQPPKSKQFQAWIGANERSMSQIEFAQMIAEHVSDIVKPEGAKMLEMAKNMRAQRGVKFASAVHTGNGDISVAYEQTTTASAGVKGNFKIPEEFEIGIPIFEGGPQYRIKCEFRYRLQEGSMTFSYSMQMIDRVVDDAFDEIISTLQKGVMVDVMYGTPAFSR